MLSNPLGGELRAEESGSGLEDLSEEELARLGEMSLKELLDQPVVSSTKVKQRRGRAPAVVTVISRAEIRRRGWTSLAELLRAVPGLYDIHDLSSHNFGVRGINGGARASGNVLKLLVDSQPVDFRPTTGNFFGEELIPIELVERVEIIRGPVSALYGANALLGLVNVITRSGAEIDGVHLVGQGALVRTHPGAGGGFVAGGKAGAVEVLVGASHFRLDRSGLRLPATSPVLGGGTDGIDPEERSQQDISRPRSIFGKLAFSEVLAGRLTLSASVQGLDTAGEFQDIHPLTHGTRIATVNQNYGAVYELQLSDTLSLNLAGQYFTARPSSRDRRDVGSAEYVFRPSVGVDGGSAAAEVSLKALTWITATAGSAVVIERELLQTFDQQLLVDILGSDGAVLRTAGTLIPGDAHGEKRTLRNLSGFAQLLVDLDEDWSVVAGARLDDHNVYGLNPSARVAVVHAPVGAALSWKLLYGSSFKAPSAVQLYTQPMRPFDIQGNPQLRPQTAHTVEVALSYRLPAQRGGLDGNVFLMNVADRVEFVQMGLYKQAQNVADEWVAGGELEAHLLLVEPLRLRVLAGIARTVSRATRSLFRGLPPVDNPLFPSYQVHIIADYRLPLWGLRAGAELSYIGARAASQSNALENGGNAYHLPGYLYSAVSLLAGPVQLVADHDTELRLRIGDLLGLQREEPGFGGIDLPSPGRTVTITVVQEL